MQILSWVLYSTSWLRTDVKSSRIIISSMMRTRLLKVFTSTWEISWSSRRSHFMMWMIRLNHHIQILPIVLLRIPWIIIIWARVRSLVLLRLPDISCCSPVSKIKDLSLPVSLFGALPIPAIGVSGPLYRSIDLEMSYWWPYCAELQTLFDLSGSSACSLALHMVSLQVVVARLTFALFSAVNSLVLLLGYITVQLILQLVHVFLGPLIVGVLLV